MLSIVVSWRDRDELKVALPQLVNTRRLANGDLAVVNFGGSRDKLCKELGEYSSHVRVVDVRNQAFFNKPRSQNIGAFCTQHSVLFFCDCDIIVDPESIVALADTVRKEDRTFATLRGVKETEVNSRRAGHVVQFGYELRLRTADGRSLTIVDHEEDASDGTRDAPGILVVRREHFLDVGGYNSRLPEGWEDQDMIARLTLGAGLRRVCDGVAQHISHDDEARMKHYPSTPSRWENRDKMFRAAMSNYDRGDFHGSYTQDTNTIAFECEGE